MKKIVPPFPLEAGAATSDRRRPASFSPFINAGVISVDELSELVETMRAAGAKNVKLGGEIVFVWEGGSLPKSVEKQKKWKANRFKARAVRPVKMCSAETFCQRFKRPVLELAFEINRRFEGAELPAKLVIGVSGCRRSCSEPATKDIGIRAHPKGYEILIGGAAGMKPMIAKSFGIVKTKEEVIKIIGRVIKYLKSNGKPNVRLGRLVEETGAEEFGKKALGLK